MFMANEQIIGPVEGIPSVIHFIRGQRVMLDSDLAQIYGVTTKRLKEQFKRNRDRFPADFAFQLTNQEFMSMRSQIATASKRNIQHSPYVFTEHGAIMLASILNSPVAIEASVRVVRAFVYLREQIAGNRQLAAKFAELEKHLGEHDEAITTLFEAIRQMLEPASKAARREIGFHVKEQAKRYRTRNGN
jgi:hypothetical protein